MRALPNIVVVSPGDPNEARLATRALAALDGPAYLRLGKAGEPTVDGAADGGFSLGSMRSIRHGTDVTVIATGSILTAAVAAADELERDGVSVRVLSAHTLRPFDGLSLVRALSETAGVVTVEEHRLIGGLRSAAGEALVDAESWPSGRIVSLGVPPDTTMGTGDQMHLRSASGLGTEAIVQAARGLLTGRSHP
jgi:transketolase